MAGRLAERVVLALALMGAAAIALVGAGGLLAAAFYLWVLGYVEPPAAAALTAVVVLFFALLLFALSRLALKEHVAQPPARTPPVTGSDGAQTAQLISALAGEEIGRFLHEKPKSAAGIALVAGLAIGLSPDLRNTLGSLINHQKH